MIDQGGASIDRIEFLARSQSRVRLLEALLSAERVSKTELRRRLDASRTTIDRHLEALEERNWIREVDGEYTITRVGELVAEKFLSFVETVGAARGLAPAIEWLPTEFDLDMSALDDAEVVLANPKDPYSVMHRHARRLRAGDHVRGIAPIAELYSHETNHETVVRNGASVELIVEPEVADTYWSDPAYRRLTEEMARTSRFELHVHDGTVPYGVVILDDTVQIIAIDDEGMPRALIETEAPAAREWAERIYRQYLEKSGDATVIGIPQLAEE